MPSPTDSVQLSGRSFVLSSLPSNGSRHNAPMFPHSLTQLVRNSLQHGEKENVLVCFNLLSPVQSYHLSVLNLHSIAAMLYHGCIDN